MKKALFILFITLIYLKVNAQDILISQNASISFFSSTAIEDIEGKSNEANSILDLKSKNIIFKVNNNSFQFKKKLMQEHFNENYMESDKYPFSTFKGKIIDDVDLSKNGNYTVNVEGNLTIHGVIKPYKGKVSLAVSNGIITAKTVFKVRIEDHQIKIPSIIFNHIAEFVEVRISAVYHLKNP